MNKVYDIIIVGAGAAGLFLAGEICEEIKSILIVENNKKPGLKIQISGGGRCNFTNKEVNSEHFYSENKHFSKSALKGFKEIDFIQEVEAHNIEYYEKKLGQLFCKKNSKEIINMLLAKINAHVEFSYEARVENVQKNENFELRTSKGMFYCKKLVIASGGLAFPKLGATNIGYKVAEHFGHSLTPIEPALVPFTFQGTSEISGISLPVKVSTDKKEVIDDLLFTHKGFSGPAILKTSLYWTRGDEVKIDFLPNKIIAELIKEKRVQKSKIKIINLLKENLPERFIKNFVEVNLKNKKFSFLSKSVQDISNKEILIISDVIHDWIFVPTGTEGHDKAEVTKGGVSLKNVSSKTMESQLQSGLYFIGEVLDVTGLLGGYNFQWAWSSAMALAKHLLRD